MALHIISYSLIAIVCIQNIQLSVLSLGKCVNIVLSKTPQLHFILVTGRNAISNFWETNECSLHRFKLGGYFCISHPNLLYSNVFEPTGAIAYFLMCSSSSEFNVELISFFYTWDQTKEQVGAKSLCVKDWDKLTIWNYFNEFLKRFSISDACSFHGNF